MAVGQRPHRPVPRPRDPVDRRLRAGRACTCAGPSPRRRASSTSCSAPSPRPSSSTASPWSTAPPARPTSSTIADLPRRPTCLAARRGCCWPASPCCWSGFGFKVAAVPFHAWTPRRLPGLADPGRRLHGLGREGRRLRRPAPGLRRRPSPTYAADWQPIVYVLAVLTLVVGAVLAVVQTNVKRMLAYSSINHAGFILVGVAGRHRPRAPRRRSSTWPPTRSWSPARFGVVTVVGRTRRRRHHARRLHGAWPRAARCWPSPSPCSCWPRPACRFTSGFFAKFYVIERRGRRQLVLAGHRGHGLRGHRRPSSTCASSWPCTCGAADGDDPPPEMTPPVEGVRSRPRPVPPGHPGRGPVPPHPCRRRRGRLRRPRRRCPVAPQPLLNSAH